jgi:hypothetical protein
MPSDTTKSCLSRSWHVYRDYISRYVDKDTHIGILTDFYCTSSP